ncbi:MAG: class F sortase [Actinomycetota bacterium]|nr:class F sortase [Actinomycetota bacterium]
MPASRPARLRIPAIGVDSPVQALGLNADDTLQVPAPGPHYNEAAWYDGSPTPGQLGASVLEGHVDSAANGPSVFFKLGALKPGDPIYVTRRDGTTAVFTVNAVRRYPKNAFPTNTVYGAVDHAALRLITCGGTFDRNSGHYVDNIVVFAHLTAVRQ